MNVDPHSTTYKQYRAPKQHGDALICPPSNQAGKLISGNQRLQQKQGTFASIRDRARSHLVTAALKYTREYRDIAIGDNLISRPIVMSGHQPTLFHPGVWFKNFALSKIAEQQNAVPINLVIDNDAAASSEIRVPFIDSLSGKAKYRSIAFDRLGGGVPYEQFNLSDPSRFESFPNRVTECIRSLVETPCVNPLWMHARAAIQRSMNVGTIFSEARHSLEAHCGLETLELPLSTICESNTFSEFALMILDDLPRFHECYNESIEDYRLAHRIRSTSHPVPNLQTNDEWHEAPFWIYGEDNPKRRPAWIRKAGKRLIISDGEQRERVITLTEPTESSDAFHEMTDDQFKIRPRALITTMYARIILSDLFLHGIGGGKYDQLGDRIIRRFFSFNPPHFTVISATATLPVSQKVDNQIEINRIQRTIRDTVYQPETFAQEMNLPETLITQKQSLLTHIPKRGQRKQWHLEMESLNKKLAKHLLVKRNQLRGELQSKQIESNSARILANREHPFCLFDLNHLNEVFESMLLEAN